MDFLRNSSRSFKPLGQFGFTLVELLVTVSVLSILAAQSVAVYQSYREKAYDAVLISSLQNVRTALQASTLNINPFNGDRQYLGMYLFPDGGSSLSGAPSKEALLPGYNQNKGIFMIAGMYRNGSTHAGNKSAMFYYAYGVHCLGTGNTIGFDNGIGEPGRTPEISSSHSVDIGFYKSEDCINYGY